MFLTRLAEDDVEVHHELDFRFENPPDAPFIFVHHGLNLTDLAETIDLAKFGSVFYMINASAPFTALEVIREPSLFGERYGATPAIAHGKYPLFDLAGARKFFLGSWLADPDQLLDCLIVGAHDRLSEQDLATIASATAADRSFASWNSGSVIGVHDNHFVYIQARGIDLLRELVEESILGFFHLMRPAAYARIPIDLLDRIVEDYQIAPLVCVPDDWTDEAMDIVPTSAVHFDGGGIHIIIQTCESSWTGDNLNVPNKLLDRRFTMSYDLPSKSWSLEVNGSP